MMALYSPNTCSHWKGTPRATGIDTNTIIRGIGRLFQSRRLTRDLTGLDRSDINKSKDPIPPRSVYSVEEPCRRQTVNNKVVLGESVRGSPLGPDKPLKAEPGTRRIPCPDFRAGIRDSLYPYGQRCEHGRQTITEARG